MLNKNRKCETQMRKCMAMWVKSDVRNRSCSDQSKFNTFCLNCNIKLVSVKSRCNDCKEFFIQSLCRICDTEHRNCDKCNLLTEQQNRRTRNIEETTKNNNHLNLGLCIAVFFILGFICYISLPYKTTMSISEKLRGSFPSQKNETWYHILSVLEIEIPTVKSIILLHEDDSTTSDCLTRQLVKIYNGEKNIQMDEITFGSFTSEVRDYGELLEFYLPIVRKHRVFVTNLNKVSSSVARIFHSLCDEVSSDIKPSLFIFTLKYDRNIKKVRPMERATTILKQAWSELPDSDLFPLLSRVARNVVDVMPEDQIPC